MNLGVLTMKIEDLILTAKGILKNSYSPYSKFRVGAAVLTESDKVYVGVNVENASYGGTICAERSALCHAVTDGERKIKVIAIASDQEDYIFPCGICRQFMAEFAEESTIIICANGKGEYVQRTLREILPNYFTL
jgi:cytidine deaminase